MNRFNFLTFLALLISLNIFAIKQVKANEVETEKKQHRSWQQMKMDNNKVTIPIYCQDSSLAAISTLLRGNYGVDIREEHLLSVLLEKYSNNNRICQDSLVPVMVLQDLLLSFGFKLVVKTPESILGFKKANKSKQSDNLNTSDNQLITPYITLLLRGTELDYVVVKGVYPKTQEVLLSDPKNNLENTILENKIFQYYQNAVTKQFVSNTNSDLLLHWEITPLDYMYVSLPQDWEERSKNFMSQNITRKAHPTKLLHLISPILPLAQ